MKAEIAAGMFRIERSTRILAAPDAICPLIEDFRRWRDWSPYEGLDPDLKRGHSGAPAGRGAVYTWDGNRKAGAGRMEVVAVEPARRVTIQLDFTRPMRARNEAEFILEPEGDGTRVTWAMTGRKSLPFRVMGLFIDMDNLIGRDFAKGLANLKVVVEGTGPAIAS